MITLNAFTNGFAGCNSSIGPKRPRRVRWVYYQNPFPGPTVFEDGHLLEYDPAQIDTPVRMGWLHEPKALHPENYDRMWNARGRFDYIFTYNPELRQADPARFKFTIHGGVRLGREHWGLGPKTGRVALMANQKRSVPGHLLRREIAERFGARVDVYGLQGWAEKAALKPYRFIVCVEPDRAPDYFTDHLLDALALGAVPLYWGAPNIEAYLNPAGILPFGSLEELDALLAEIERHGDELYAAKVPVLAENLARLDQYEFAEDWMVERSELRTLFARFEETSGIHQS